MKVSVVIPTCDRPAFLSRAVKSVLSQQYYPLEIIIVDNGSKKVSLSDLPICSDLSIYSIDARVGASKARNFGIKKATGDVVCFLDDDDIWSEYYLTKIVQAFESANFDIVLTEIKMFRDQSEVGRKCFAISKKSELFYKNPGVIGSNICVSKKVALDIMFDENLRTAEDRDFLIRALNNNKVLFIEQSVSAIQILHDGERLSDNIISGGFLLCKKHFKNISFCTMLKVALYLGYKYINTLPKK